MGCGGRYRDNCNGVQQENAHGSGVLVRHIICLFYPLIIPVLQQIRVVKQLQSRHPARQHGFHVVQRHRRQRIAVEIIDIVVQRGSDYKSYSDGISVFIRDPDLVKETLLGTEIDLGGLGGLVEMTLYLNATCPGVARIPVVYGAVSGTIRFDSLFVPWLDNDTEETAAVFTNVELVDQQDPLERRAVLDGDFRFLFERGRPPQLF